MTDTPAQLFEEILKYLWRSSPAHATSVGIHDHDDRLADFDAAAIAERVRRLSAFARDLAALQEATVKPTPDELLDARVLRDAIEVDARLLSEMRAPFRDPGVYLDEILYGFYYLIQRDFTSLPERAWLAARRLREGTRVLREARENLSRPDEIPLVWIEAVLGQVAGSADFFAQVAREVVPIAGSGGADLAAAIRTTTEELESFTGWLRSDLAPAARGDFAIGRPLFEFLLRTQHGLDLDSGDLHRFGVERAKQARLRLEEAARGLDPGRGWEELVTAWKSDHPLEDDFIVHYRREVERARAFVESKRLVTLPPGERLQVAETPSFQRALCPFAAYLAPGAFESTRIGVLWVTPPTQGASEEARRRHLEDHLLAGIPGTAAHEAYPGHHLQLSIASRIASRVRRSLLSPVMVEGWGFYCEEMMADEGFYGDPRSRVLQLKDELWRSCRVVIDVGIQTRGMSLDQAVGILHEEVRLAEASARAEVRRYTRMPTQPMSYAVGKHEILKLREDYRRMRGPAFSLREFHDRFLSYGSIPIARIRERLLEAA